MIIFYNRGNYTIYELRGANHFLYAFQGGANHFFVYISGGANQFLHVFQGGARSFLTGIFYVWPHTCPITIASSLKCIHSSPLFKLLFLLPIEILEISMLLCIQPIALFLYRSKKLLECWIILGSRG